jgi:translation elongation factor P/translation initiation factor 5A
MVTAAELKAGMVIRVEGQIYKVLEVESKVGAAKLGSNSSKKRQSLQRSKIQRPVPGMRNRCHAAFWESLPDGCLC